MRSQRLLILAILTATAVSAARREETLGEIAAKERARRSGKATQVITTDELKRAGKRTAPVVDEKVRARILENETAAIWDACRMALLEKAYSSANAGLYDTPECLGQPHTCIPGVREGSRRTPWAPLELRQSESVSAGYKRVFFPGPPPTAPRAGMSRSSVTAFAYILTPMEPGASGRYSFCVDSDRVVYYIAPEDQLGRAALGKCDRPIWRELMPVQKPDTDLPVDVARMIRAW
jgi:hypothetical protein